MHGTGHADVMVVLQMPGNKADAVPCERLQNFNGSRNTSGYVKIAKIWLLRLSDC